MQKTAIGWTDYSANPLKYRDADGRIVWGCAKVSPGCANCYSAELAKRWNRGGDYNAAEMAKLTPYLDEKEMLSMLRSKAIAGKRVFVCDMTDLFGAWVPDDLLDRLFTLFAARPDVTWQVLTKRADMMRDFLSDGKRQPLRWPLPNVWLGVSCEDQQRADERIPHLLQTPAAVRFISAEPLLGDILNVPALDWVIVGGESGPRYRQCELSAIANIIDNCRVAHVPVFVKQDAHRLPGQQGRIPDSYFVQEFPA